jgi:hypothetical protein
VGGRVRFVVVVVVVGSKIGQRGMVWLLLWFW